MHKPAFILLLLALAGPLAAQRGAKSTHPDVPATMDVAGIHLVLTEEAQELVQQKADALCRHQPSFQARVDLADGSFPIIDRVLQQEGVPLDFRYLVLQESALRGDAQSIHDAVGYWQLKQGTATDLGLLVNDEVDERKHLTASTRAAARYLSRNNANLRNWVNALLSYNTGLGGVRPYTLPTDAGATQMSITAQTSPYVLMFLAQKVAFEPACGQNPTPPLRLQEFPALPGQSLAAQAQTIYADPAALAQHNRWLLAPVVPTDRPYTLIVPVTDAAQAAGLVANQRLSSGRELINTPTINAKNQKEVRVNNLRALIALPGETKEELARRGKVRLGHFLRYNELGGFDAVAAGQPYYLESKRDVGSVEYHVLQPGETLADIAQKYGMRRKSIVAKNRMSRHEDLRAGRVLWLQHSRPREVAVEYRTDFVAGSLELPVGSPRPAPTPAPVVKLAPAAVVKPAENDSADIDAATEALNEMPVKPKPAPLPVAAAEPVVALPPPAPLPSAPLDDEPRPQVAPARPVAVAAPPIVPEPVAAPVAPVVRPVPAPAKAPVPAPAVVKPAPTPTPAVLPTPAAEAVLPIPTSGQHQVAPKETVYSLARRYGLRPADLLAWNKLPPNSGLTIGQVVQLRPAGAPEKALPALAPAPAATKAPAAPRAASASKVNPALYVPRAKGSSAISAAAAEPRRHTVVVGETLYSIARRYNVKVAELQSWNNKNTDAVQLGEVLLINGTSKN
jgi:membrane-bound lytic murein transglycosylase D